MNKIMEQLKKRANGYEQVEEISEYVVDEKGVKRLVKEKVQVKKIPPDVSAIKLYIEQSEKANAVTTLTDEELERERKRLLSTLK